VQIRGLDGALSANSVSGDVAATGSIRKATIDTVSGGMLVDSTDRVDLVSLNTVSGDATVRLDEGHPANFAAQRQRPAHGRRRQALDLRAVELRRLRRGAQRQLRRRARELGVGRRHGAAPLAGGSGCRGIRDRRGELSMPPVFSHGDLRLYLLNLLDESPRHGYDLMQALSDRTGGTYTPSAGTIYPRLSKLEEEGLVTKTVDGRKTVYAITEAGRAEVAARAHELEDRGRDSPTACA
jgi:DNA-binding PadR family transcriptional regulator